METQIEVGSPPRLIAEARVLSNQLLRLLVGLRAGIVVRVTGGCSGLSPRLPLTCRCPFLRMAYRIFTLLRDSALSGALCFLAVALFGCLALGFVTLPGTHIHRACRGGLKALVLVFAAQLGAVLRHLPGLRRTGLP